MRDEFYLTKGYRSSYCKACHNKEFTPKIRLIQATSRQRATNHRKPWTKEEIVTMLEMIKNDDGVKKIARKLGRTMYSVNNMVHRIDNGYIEIGDYS